MIFHHTSCIHNLQLVPSLWSSTYIYTLFIYQNTITLDGVPDPRSNNVLLVSCINHSFVILYSPVFNHLLVLVFTFTKIRKVIAHLYLLHETPHDFTFEFPQTQDLMPRFSILWYFPILGLNVIYWPRYFHFEKERSHTIRQNKYKQRYIFQSTTKKYVVKIS